VSIRPALSIRPSHILAIVLAAFSISFVANVGTAAAVPGPNQTVLTLDPVIVGALKVAKVKVVPVGAASVGSAGFYFPVINSNVNDLFVGTTKHQGGFELRVDKLRFGFRNIQVKTKKGDPATGTVTAEPIVLGFGIGFQLPLGNISVESVKLRSPGVIAKYPLRLDKNIAKILNGALGIKVLTPGAKWATIETRIARDAPTPAPVPETPQPV
jgi:hypothetical protein